MPHRSLKPIDSTEARIYRIQNVPRSQSIEAEVYRNRSPSKPRSFENRSPSKLRSVRHVFQNNAWFLGGAPPDWSDWPARAGSAQKLRMVSGRGLRMVSAGGRHTLRARW